MKNLGLILIVFLFTASCSIDPELKPIVSIENVKEIVPNGWPEPIYTFKNNPLTPDGFILGRALFYEPMLSKNNTISCGSCHQQFAAFSHSGHDVSHGINGLLGTRNAPTIQNTNWMPNFMHDGGIIGIEVMPLGPITNPVEMDENMTDVIAKLKSSGKYKQLFLNAYGDNEINTQRIFRTLAQFMGTMYSYNSKYDLVKSGKASFTKNEQLGYNLFVQKCESCHKEPLFSDFGFRNNGLSINQTYKDSGRAHITGNPSDRYKFKTPSLRNIEKSEPYMHDGRFTTLEQCLDHYVSGIKQTDNLDPKLINGISLTAAEKSNLIAFLKTLTDTKYLNDLKFTDPN